MLQGIQAGLAGMHRYARTFDRAAEQVARTGIVDVASLQEPDALPVSGPAESADASLSVADDALLDSMVTMMLAQRMFAASAKVVQNGDEMLRDAIDALGGG